MPTKEQEEVESTLMQSYPSILQALNTKTKEVLFLNVAGQWERQDPEHIDESRLKTFDVKRDHQILLGLLNDLSKDQNIVYSWR